MRGPAQTLVAASAWHALPAAKVVEQLRTSSTSGLTVQEAEARARSGGLNVLPEGAPRSLARVFFGQFKSPLIYLLFGAAMVALAIGERTDAAVIVVVVTLNAVIGTLQERRAQRSMEALRRLSLTQVRVLRGGAEVMLEARQLVVGDVMLLSAGDAVSADARLLDAAVLEVAEAALTGESVPVAKCEAPSSAEAVLADRESMVFAGTHVTKGRAKAVVVAIGGRTEVGQIAALTVAAEEPPTPLERKVAQFGRTLVIGAVAIFATVLAIGLVRGNAFAEILMVAVSQMVSVVPEGLPVAMTIALAVGMQRMAARGTIVRRLAAVEALGSTTVICTDKTGTLTRNEMTVTQVALPDGRLFEVSGGGLEREGFFSHQGQRVKLHEVPELRRLLEAAAQCNDAHLEPTEDGRRWRGLGDPTEVALLVAAEKGQISVEQLRRAAPRRAELPFSAETKLMATVQGDRLFMKGAPEVVGALCAAPVDPASAALVRRLTGEALRVLAVASAPAPAGPIGLEALNGRMVLLGWLGQFDPPRDEVRDAVMACGTAGIRTVMVTGDHQATGHAVASMLGIARPGDVVIDGPQLETMSDSALAEILPKVTVFARVHSAQKLRIVRALQAKGEVVAMTGDGVNDAPALAQADVGVAMGQTGTDVAKEASKIVIADDNFATIVKAVEEGRVVYRNVKAAILMLLAAGAAEVLVLLAALALGYPLIFTAVMILWNNVVTEGTITVNLVMEPREGDEMHRAPISPREPLLTSGAVWRLLSMSLTIASCVLGYFTYRLSQGIPFAQVQTATFTLLVVCEWFNVLNCRSRTQSALTWSVLKNRWLAAGILLSNLLHLLVVYHPFLNGVFRTVPIPLSEAVVIGTVASVVLWVEEARKWIMRRRTQVADVRRRVL